MLTVTDLFRRVGYSPRKYAFTIVEVVIVMVILAIAAMLAVPLYSGASDIQLGSAANTVAADLEYAKSMAMSRGQNYSVVFDKNTESYRITDSAGATIANQIKKGFNYVITFGTGSYLDKVGITDVVFNSVPSSTITFDYLGSPYSGSGTGTSLNSGTITLGAGNSSITVSIEPVTGFITISK